MARRSVFSGALWGAVLTGSDWLRIAIWQRPAEHECSIPRITAQGLSNDGPITALIETVK
jgi:hypothetical protein